MSMGWLVNDVATTIPGTKTLWHDLLEWIPGLSWQGDIPFGSLAHTIEERYRFAGKDNRPDYIIRNGSYFGPIDIPVPDVVLIQDLNVPGQVDVIDTATKVVFNSYYTATHVQKQRPYAMSSDKGSVIPLSIDFDLFKPGGNPGNSVCWVGAATDVKGWDFFVKIVRANQYIWFILVMKDGIPHEMVKTCGNVSVYTGINHRELVSLYNSCSLGLVTSRVETQHLAGLEMGACGLPLLTTNVGAYWNRDSGAWGGRLACLDPGYVGKQIHGLMERKAGRDTVRQYWLQQGFDRGTVEEKWWDIVKEIAPCGP